MGRGMRVAMFALAGLICVGWVAHAQTKPTRGAASKAAVPVPFVGCKADGQLGPVAAPKGSSKEVHISADEAQRLAYYQARDGLWVLGPRGWYCFETYGSSGRSLFVSPRPVNKSRFFAYPKRSVRGYAIEVDDVYGGTSGRFGVAAVIARVFPAYLGFVKKVVAEEESEGIHAENDFPRGPYPTDKLTYVGKNMVEFTTPANTKGLGTDSLLAKNSEPIHGIAILAGSTPDLYQLSMRLPPKMKGLEAAIIRGVKEEAARDKE